MRGSQGLARAHACTSNALHLPTGIVCPRHFGTLSYEPRADTACAAEIDKEARAAKKVVIERATKEKKEISDRATAKRTEANDAAEARRKELEAAQQAEIEALPGAGEAEL